MKGRKGHAVQNELAFVQLFAIGKTTTLNSPKYAAWRSYEVGNALPLSLFMNAEDRDILAHVLNKRILVVTLGSSKNGKSKLNLTIHIPILGKKSMSRHKPVVLNKDYTMHYVSDRRSMTREHIDVPEMMKQEKLIVVQNYCYHYDGISLQGISSREHHG